MDRRTFVTSGIAAAIALLTGGCERYRRVNNPDPNDWTGRNRDWDWIEDDDHFPDRDSQLRTPDRDTTRKPA